MDLKAFISDEMRIVAGQSFKEREYWLNILSRISSVSNFYNEYELNNTTETGNSCFEFNLGQERSYKLTKISNSSDKRLFLVLKACFDILLYKYSGNNIFLTSTSIESQEVEGNFINTILPLITEINNDMTFKEVVLKAKDIFTDACENQNYPLLVLFEELTPSKDPSNVMLPFDVGIIFDKIHNVKYLESIKLNIIFKFSLSDGIIHCTLDYNNQIYNTDKCQDIAKRFLEVIDCIINNLDVLVKNICIISDSEKKELLEDFNDTEYDFNNNKRIIEHFQDIAKSFPNNPILYFDFESDNRYKQTIKKKKYQLDNNRFCSYGSINSYTNQLGRYLKEKGIEKKIVVALLFERSIEMIEAILAVLKVGGIYVPIDPSYPVDRIKYILNDCSANIILSTSNQSKLTSVLKDSMKVVINIDQIDTSNFNDTNISISTTANDPMYIIYTSGSTGRPKGVLVKNNSVENTILSRLKNYSLGIDDCVMQLFSYAFDGFVTSFFSQLLAGSKIVLPTEEEILDVSKIVKIIKKQSVTQFIAIPNLYKEILNCIKNNELTSLKLITLAGDKVHASTLAKSNEKLPYVEIAQEYGVTEAAVMSTIFRNQNKSNEILIGKPVHNTKILVLNSNGDIQPTNVLGALCIVGEGVSEGYINNQELTHDKFKKSIHYKNQRQFNTGDIVRWSPSGNLEFIGRSDTQVKVRGYRIEIGEIEAQLNKLREVEMACVIAKKDNNNDNYLTAFVKLNSGINIEKIRGYILDILPVYYLPQHFVKLEKFPITHNGKIDRRALLHLNVAIENDEQVTVPPQNDLQRSLVELWKKELNIKEIGITHNYFNIGGDSIKSIRIVHAVNEELNQSLEVVDLYMNNTVEKLASYIDQLEQKKSPNVDNNLDIISELDELKNVFINKI